MAQVRPSRHSSRSRQTLMVRVRHRLHGRAGWARSTEPREHAYAYHAVKACCAATSPISTASGPDPRSGGQLLTVRSTCNLTWRQGEGSCARQRLRWADALAVRTEGRDCLCRRTARSSRWEDVTSAASLDRAETIIALAITSVERAIGECEGAVPNGEA